MNPILSLHRRESADDGADVFVQSAESIDKPVKLVVNSLDHLQLPLPRVIAGEPRPLHPLHVLPQELHGELRADVERFLTLLRGFKPDGDELLHFTNNGAAGGVATVARFAAVFRVHFHGEVVFQGFNWMMMIRCGLVLGAGGNLDLRHEGRVFPCDLQPDVVEFRLQKLPDGLPGVLSHRIFRPNVSYQCEDSPFG